jgi:peptidoglycan/xylan/chitin deacetylase (PgdA/CDA1 family)
MFLALMYHHCESDEFSNSKEMLEKHFSFIANHYETIFCGERLSLFKTKLLLVFDDAFFDFYYYVYPLLKKYKLKAVLSVPTKYILDDTDMSTKTRLSIKHRDMIYNPDVIQYAPFCTWKEIQEMVRSGYVEIASHTVNHPNLINLNTRQIEYELKHSKEVIESKLGIKCNAFTYPYGAFNEKIRSMVKKYYKYDIAIGSVYNFSWSNVIYRIYADDLKDCCELFSFKNRIKYFFRAVVPQGVKRRIKWLIGKSW